MSAPVRPWAALWTLIIGFFMILVDSTIVSVATPDIMRELHTDTTGAVWVTSAYLLAYAVPLLLAGRLGDRFGQKQIYLIGLATFTLASLVCGLAPSLTVLIVARVVQGLGAALITPQTMSVVMRIFAPDRRGPAMAVWGTVGGIAAVVGPLAGGALVNGFGWPWIFYVNVPVGVVGFILAILLVPSLPTVSRGFDLIGVVLSGLGLASVVLGVQEGGRYDWGTITGVITVPALIIIGLVFLLAFVIWQAHNRHEPLMPLSLFRHRDFTLASIGMVAMGFAITCVGIPLMLYAQNVLGYTPLTSALLLLPMAAVMIGLARIVGKLIGTLQARLLAAFGFACMIAATVWIGSILSPHITGWALVVPSALIGVGSAFISAPLSTTAMRGVPLNLAGAASGTFNALRQIGAVLGGAAIAAIMQTLLTSQFPHGTAGLTPATLADGYAHAMGHSLYLPAAVSILGFAASVLLPSSRPPATPTTPQPSDASSARKPGIGDRV